jgi:hypothetical protein
MVAPVMVTMRESLSVTIALTVFVFGFGWGYYVGHANGRMDEITGRYKDKR